MINNKFISISTIAAVKTTVPLSRALNVRLLVRASLYLYVVLKSLNIITFIKYFHLKQDSLFYVSKPIGTLVRSGGEAYG